MANEYKLSYTANEINKKLGQIDSLASKDEIPTKLSDLVDDKYYVTTSDVKNQYALRPPALVSFIDDDCRIETYDKLFPVILDLNIPYAIACPPGNIGVTDGYMSLDDFANMANNENITVTCHHKTQTNMNAYASVDAYAADLDECLAWYEANGISNVRTVCYPQGVYVDEYMQTVRDRFAMGFTTDRGINQMPQESYYMRRCELFPTNGKYTFDDAKELVSEVATNGGWLIFMTHAWYPTFDVAKLTELVQHIQGIENVEIVGIDEAISKVGNKVEIGNFHKPIADLSNPYFVIDAVGNTYTNGYKTADLSLRTKKIISTTGPVVTTSDIEYVVSDKFDITGQTSVIVSGWASDGYGLYVFYDDAGNRKKVAYSTKVWNEGGDLLKNVEVQVPEGATQIVIAGYFRQQMPCLKVVDTLNLGNLAAKDTVARTDLATDVQTSLGKADTALQSYTETDPTVPTWAKQPQKPSYSLDEINGADEQIAAAVDAYMTNNSVSGRCPERLYVEDYKTDGNTWNDAFAALFADCLSAGSIACTGGSYYALTAPLYIGNIDVDFENCELYNNVAESETNPACVVLTGAEKKIHKFGTVTGRQSIGILVNTANGTYKFNRVYAKLIQGYSHALCISTTNYTCCFNEFHVPLLKSCVNPLAVYCASTKTKWANECHFYLETIEGYRSTIPTLLINMTNLSRCNVYNVDLECGDYITPNPNHTVAVELTNCKDVAFYNPRTKEPFNAVQFRFVGESFDNFIDSTYCKYRTIDSSKMIMSDAHYNVWRGRVSTGNAGTTTNCDTLRIYKDMVVPENINSMVREVSENFTVSSSLINKTMDIVPGEVTHGGIPTLLKWLGGDITIDKRFIALLPTTIQIMRVTDAVGNILDTDGNIILAGSDLELNKRYDIQVNGATYAIITGETEDHRKYPYFHDISLAIGDFVEEAPEEWIPPQIITHEFTDGFVRTNGTMNTTSTNYTYTGLVEYMGGSIDFRSVSASSGVTNSAVAFFDAEQAFLGNLETAVGGFDTFYSQYNTKEYATINGSDIGADVMGGTITAEQIAEWYPDTAYIAVSCPITASGIITMVYNAIENPCMAKQTY